MMFHCLYCFYEWHFFYVLLIVSIYVYFSKHLFITGQVIATGSPESGGGPLPPTWSWLWFIRNEPQNKHPQEGTVLVLLFMLFVI